MNRNISNDGMPDEMPQHAVSLYGQNDGVEDFPVLKAFQQYIDAEQEKARKRILMLGIFFGAILVVVVAVFLFMLHGINMRNQNLSDRMVEYAMREADRRQALIAQQQPQTVSAQGDAVLKSMTETLVALQRKLEDNQVTKQSPTTDSVLSARVLEETEKINLAKAKLEAEKKQLEEERERLRQIEIDRQRRKLYPELYENAANAPSHRKSRTLTDDDIREIIREAYSDHEDAESVKSDKSTSTSKDLLNNKDDLEIKDDDTAIEYFKDDDYNIPVEVKGSTSKIKFTVPVN